MTNVYRIPVTTVGGQQMCGVEGVALMIGVPAEQIDPNAPMPPEWLEQAKIRADEAAEHTVNMCSTGAVERFAAWLACSRWCAPGA